jgi:hypothetical protein
MGKNYQYTIYIASVSSVQHLEEVMNEYAKRGYRVISVSRTDNVLYDGNVQKYTLYLERKLKDE